MNICIICNENITDIMHYTLKSIDGNTITICDYCFQELSILEKIDGVWVTYVIHNNKKYFEVK